MKVIDVADIRVPVIDSVSADSNYPFSKIIENTDLDPFRMYAASDNAVRRETTRMMNRIEIGSYMAIKDSVRNFENLYLKDDAICKILSSKKLEILNWFDSRLQTSNHISTMIDQLFLILDLGIEWPELLQIVSKHKTIIIKQILIRIKSDPSDPIVITLLKSYVEKFLKLGIRWPELKVIWTSLNKISKDLHLDESADPRSNVWYEHAVNLIRDENLYGLDRIARIYKISYSNNELFKNLIDSNKWIILRTLEKSIKHETSVFVETVENLQMLKNMGVNWPELITFWDDNKRAVVKQLLKTIVSDDPNSTYYAWMALDMLLKSGLKWSELDTIHKSLAADLSIKESIHIELNNI